jgi:hypothetical protein
VLHAGQHGLGRGASVSRLFRRTKRSINFAHPPLKIIGQSIEPSSHRAIGGLIRKATAFNDLILNCAKVIQNVHPRVSLSSGSVGVVGPVEAFFFW